MNAALAAHGVDGNDVGVVQIGGRLGFVLEALQVLGIQSAGKGEDL